MAALRSILLARPPARRDRDRVLRWRWRRRLDGARSRGMSGYAATNLVSDLPRRTFRTANANADPTLVNAWGVAFNPQGFVWVANNGTSTSTLYDGNGVPQSLVVVDSRRHRRQRQADRHRLQRHAGLHGHARRQDRRERLHLRRRGRHAVGLVARRRPDQCHHWSSTARPRRGLQGPRDRQPGRRAAALRGGLPQRARRRVRRELRSRSPRRRLRRPALPAGYAPFGIQAIGDRSTSPTPSRTTQTRRRRSRRRARRSSTSSTPPATWSGA